MINRAKTATATNVGFTHEDFAKLLDKYDYHFSPGDIVAGTVFSIEPRGALIDIGAKTAAYIPIQEMSINRVDQPEEVSQRLAIRPGISGWAQVNGGKLITPDEKNALDLWHIGHVSFSLEMKIVLMTLLVMLRGDIRREEEISEAVNWLRQQTNSSTNNSKNGI